MTAPASPWGLDETHQIRQVATHRIRWNPQLFYREFETIDPERWVPKPLGCAPAITPGWTLELMSKHSLDFWLTSEDLPDPENRVTIDRDGNIVLHYKPNNEEGNKPLIKKLEYLMEQQTKCPHHGHECHQGLFARNLFLGQRIPLAGSRTRMARSDSVMIQTRARSTGTARHTTWILSMSWMQASSLRAGR